VDSDEEDIMANEIQSIVTAKAPAKVILSGEHAVVYGMPAIAIAVDRYVTTSLQFANSSAEIKFNFVNTKQEQSTTAAQLAELQTVVEQRYQKYLAGQCDIGEVLQHPVELLQYAYIYLLEQLHGKPIGGSEIKVELTAPLGCGMGTSAGVILSLMRVLANHAGVTLTPGQYLEFGRTIENLQHGKSSGLDLYISLNGGCHFFFEGKATKRNLPQFPLTLINTGKPLTTTGECVAYAKKYFQKSNIADDFSEITLVMDLALQQNNFAAVQECVRENHSLLKYIGVVPEKVANFIAAVEREGGAAKVSGAGAVRGDNAGIVWVVGAVPADLVNEYGYSTINVNGDHNGLQLL
jgi:mevalonate kinase